MASAEEMERMYKELKKQKEGCCSNDATCKKPKKKHADDEIEGKSNKRLFSMIFLVLMFGGAAAKIVFSIIDIFNNPVGHLDLKNQAATKEVLFGGYPHLLQCIYPNSPYKFDDKITKEVATLLKQSNIKTMTLNCSEKLPSGKTVPERLKLPPTISMFLVVNGSQAKIVPPHLTSNAENLREWVIDNSGAKVLNIKYATEFNSLCLNKDKCLIISSKNDIPKTFIDNKILPISQNYRSIRTVTINTSKFLLKFDENFLKTRPEKAKENILCVLHSSNQEGADSFFASFYLGDSQNESELEHFFENCENTQPNNHSDRINVFMKLSDKPTLINRPINQSSTTTTTTTISAVKKQEKKEESNDDWNELLNDIHDEF